MHARAVLLVLSVALSLSAQGCRRRRSSGPDPAIRVSLELGGRGEQPIVQPEFPVSDVFWSTKAQELLDADHSLRTVRCPPNGALGPTWGTDVYTADSSVCSAAVHSGLLDLAQGGVVQIVRESVPARFRGSVRNGVTSHGFGVFPAAFRFAQGPRPGLTETPIDGPSGREGASDGPWARTLVSQRAGDHSQPVLVECPAGGSARTVWGTDVYTDDSSVCTAAVHAGLISFAQGGAVRAWLGPAQIAFRGTERNGVTSNNYGRFDGSFAFDRGAFERVPRAPEGARAIGWNESLSSRRAERVRNERVWCPPHGGAGSVWGTDVYTDDSSVCTAAVHVGLITLEEGGVFFVSNGPGRASYRGSERNGVSTNGFERFEGSFTVRR
ncbi:MAG: LCCL domain-containing protein [Polyangiales bacterium]